LEFVVNAKVLAFARYRGLLGFAEMELPLPPPPNMYELLKQPPFAALPKNALLAVNQKFVDEQGMLRDGGIVAIMPPVSGG
jgi:molybdopterin converting factor small subunit